MLALHIGKPLLGQRAEDVVTLLDFVSDNKLLSGTRIEINAKGNIGLAVIHATLFRQEINQLNLYGCIESYQQILKQPLAKDRYGLVVDNLLAYYDIADLLSWIKSTKIFFNK
jgi:hypothetical protein